MNRRKRYCEICGGEMGIMSDLAYEKGHRHCDLCVDKCTLCDEFPQCNI